MNPVTTIRATWTVLHAALWVCLTPDSRAAEWRETFDTDPDSRGWNLRGDPSLFAWDALAQRLSATWNSSASNTFFVRPLGTVLTRTDSFRFSCRLQIDELQTPGGNGSFQLALGLLHRQRAFAPEMRRGSGVHPATGPKDLVEFNYFPAAGPIASTFAAVAIGTNNLRWTTLHAFPFELRPGQVYDLAVGFDAATQSLSLEVEQDGTPFLHESTPLVTGFTDFRVDAFSVTSYSGAGQPAGYGGDLFARGWVDDIHLVYPDPPRAELALTRLENAYELRFPSPPGWVPVLERGSLDSGPGAWETVDTPPTILGDLRSIRDPMAPGSGTLYRLRLERP